MPTKTLILPADRVRPAPAMFRADGSIHQPEGTVIVDDDGNLIAAVSGRTRFAGPRETLGRLA